MSIIYNKGQHTPQQSPENQNSTTQSTQCTQEMPTSSENYSTNAVRQMTTCLQYLAITHQKTLKYHELWQSLQDALAPTNLLFAERNINNPKANEDQPLAPSVAQQIITPLEEWLVGLTTSTTDQSVKDEISIKMKDFCKLLKTKYIDTELEAFLSKEYTHQEPINDTTEQDQCDINPLIIQQIETFARDPSNSKKVHQSNDSSENSKQSCNDDTQNYFNLGLTH